MNIELFKRPENTILLEGFPGFGLVGTITSEFLLEHLKTEQIGSIWIDELPAVAAIHKGKVVTPIGLFYNEKHNLLILHVITNVVGHEWKILEAIKQITEELKVREVISIEGVAAGVKVDDPKVYYFSSMLHNDNVKNLGISRLDEGIVMGVTGALLMKTQLPMICFFADTQSQMPDSSAAAKVIEILDKYLGLEVDYEPLKEQAKKFEAKLQSLVESGKQAKSIQEKKNLSYLG